MATLAHNFKSHNLVMDVHNVVSKISFPGDNEHFFELTEGEKESLKLEKDGYAVFMKIVIRNVERIALGTKVGDRFYLLFPDGSTDTIKLDISTSVYLLSHPTDIQILLLKLPSSSRDLHFASHFESTSSLSIYVFSLANEKIATISIEASSQTLFVSSSGLEDHADTKTFFSSSYFCRVLVKQRKENLIIELNLENEENKLFQFNLSPLIAQSSVPKTPLNQQAIASRKRTISVLSNNLFVAYCEAKLEKRIKLFNQICEKYLSKYQGDSFLREIGIGFLRIMHKNIHIDGDQDTDVINLLWKRCKGSFDIQPYNVIDMKDIQLEEELGRGTFGSVKKGTWSSPDGPRPVAIKIIRENSQMFDLSDLRGELVALSVLEHENIISMHGAGFIQQEKSDVINSDNLYFIVMDLMEGSLADLIHKSTTILTYKERVDIALQVIHGIWFLHNHRVIHRDIKPENILFGREGSRYQMKVADLGIAKPETGTMAGRTAIGTHDYMAPELRHRSRLVQFSSEIDIYSFGVLLWELFTNKTAKEFHECYKQYRLRNSRIKFPPQTPKWVDSLISKCVKMKPSKRPTARDIHAQILDIYYSLTSTPANSSDLDSGISTEETLEGMTAFWLYLFGGKWRYFSTNEQRLLEARFLEFCCERTFDKELECCGLECTLHINFQSFIAEKSNNQDKILIRRQRLPVSSDVVILSCNRNRDEKQLELCVINQAGEDCSDVIVSVTYSYRENQSEFQNVTITRHPFGFVVPHCESEWISVTLDFGRSRVRLLYFQFSRNCETADEHVELLVNDLPPVLPYLTNSFKEKVSGIELQSIQQQVTLAMKQFAEDKLNEVLIQFHTHCPLVELVNGTTETKFNLFSGLGGYCYLFWKASRSVQFAHRNEELLNAARTGLEVVDIQNDLSSISFLDSITGVYALQCVVYSDLKMGEECKAAADHLMSVASKILLPEMVLSDIEYGLAGYLVSLLFVSKYAKQSYYERGEMNAVILRICEMLCEGDDCVVKHSFEQRKYYGFFHGIAGILFVLMHDLSILCPAHQKKVRHSMEYLHSCFLPEGDIVAFEGSSTVHFSFAVGVSGIVPTLIRAYEVFGEEKYLETAKKAAVHIWKHGIRRLPFSVIHGTPGNVYSYCELYRVTKEDEYLYKALMLCSTMTDPKILAAVSGVRDLATSQHTFGKYLHCHSLMFGTAGNTCLAIDIQDPTGEVIHPALDI